jgi:hypothetical protein
MLEQLPWPALEIILQQLDPCSLASTAVTCSRLRQSIPAQISKVTVQHPRTSSGFSSFVRWLERYTPTLTNLTQCSIMGRYRPGYGGETAVLRLPPQLRQLLLQTLKVQLGPQAGTQGSFPGVLQDCSRLTALHLQDCSAGQWLNTQHQPLQPSQPCQSCAVWQ